MTSSADPIEIFRQEAGELLEQLEAALLDLERSPDDRNLINTAFRALHTIKGSGAMFGFDQVAAFAHEFESAFDRVRKGDAAPEPDLIAIALNAKDFLRTQIEKPEEANAVIGMCILSDLRKLVQDPDARAALAGVAPNPPPLRRRRRMSGRRGGSACASTKTCSSTAATRCCCSTNCAPLATAWSRSTSRRRRRSIKWIRPPATSPGMFDFETAHPKSEIEDVFIFVAGDMELEHRGGRRAAGRRRRRRPPSRPSRRRWPAVRRPGRAQRRRARRNRRPSAFRPNDSMR